MNITAPIFHDEAKALAHIEASRWPNGVTCPHCGSDHVRRMGGKTQAGMFLCNDCRDKFTCRTGTVMERSTFQMHATMESALPPLRYLKPRSFEVIRRVEALRAAGTGAWVTMDAGPNVKVLCDPTDVPGVVDAIADLGLTTHVLRPGGPARWILP